MRSLAGSDALGASDRHPAALHAALARLGAAVANGDESGSLLAAEDTYMRILAERGFRLQRARMSATRAFLASFPPVRAGREPYRCLVVNETVRRSEMPELLLHMLSHVLLGHDRAYGTIIERDTSATRPVRSRDRLRRLRLIAAFVLRRRHRPEWARLAAAMSAHRDNERLHQEAIALASVIFLGKAHIGSAECLANDTCPIWLSDQRTLGQVVALADVVRADQHPRLRWLLHWRSLRPMVVYALRLTRLAYVTLRSRAAWVPSTPPVAWRERICLAEAVNASPQLIEARNRASVLSSVAARLVQPRPALMPTKAQPVTVEVVRDWRHVRLRNQS